MVRDLPECSQLCQTLSRNEAALSIYFGAIEPQLLERHPDRSHWFRNDLASWLNPQLEALHEAIWQKGKKVKLTVTEYKPGAVTPINGNPLTIDCLFGLDI